MISIPQKKKIQRVVKKNMRLLRKNNQFVRRVSFYRVNK